MDGLRGGDHRDAVALQAVFQGDVLPCTDGEHRHQKAHDQQHRQRQPDSVLPGALFLLVRLHDFQIELIQEVPSKIPELDNRKAGHIDHFALDVRDIKEAFCACRKEGYSFLTPVIKELSFFEHGIKYFLVEGPDGEVVEFNQKVQF